MAIDDPLDASEERIAAEERASSPLSRFIPNVAELTDIIPALSLVGKSAIHVAGLWVSGTEARRREYLITCIRDELRRVRANLASLDESHRRFTHEEFLPLVLDGLQKAEQTRSEGRIRRIGAILAHALDIGSTQSSDTVEEMMRIATLLADEDVIVLRSIYEGQILSFSKETGRTDHETANEFWSYLDRLRGSKHDSVMAPLAQFSTGQLQGICAKLQSFGLLAQVERNQMKVSPGVIPYGLLEKAVSFIQYISPSERSGAHA